MVTFRIILSRVIKGRTLYSTARFRSSIWPDNLEANQSFSPNAKNVLHHLSIIRPEPLLASVLCSGVTCTNAVLYSCLGKGN